jgi:hypothetical protein
VTDDSAGTSSHGLANAWDALAGQGYVLTDDYQIGLSVKFRENFVQTYFNPTYLRHDPGDRPLDRHRARDVIRYWWLGDGCLRKEEFDKITITDRADIPGERDHARFMLLKDPQAAELVDAFLGLVPPSLRQLDGTFGVNLFRTYTDVVTKPHRDNERFVILYVLDRVGDGAVSYLYRPEDVTGAGETAAEPVLWRQLNPGQILIFDDERFLHGATPLISLAGATARRDVVVCTVDYRETYLAVA